MRAAVACAVLALAVGPAAVAPKKTDDAAVGALVPDPFPSLKGAGDSIYTTLSPLLTQVGGASDNPKAAASAAVKGALNKKTHALSNVKHDALGPLGTKAYETWVALAAKQWAAFNASGGVQTCDPSKKPADTADAFSFAFSGSGNLIPFHLGVVQGLQARGVLSPDVVAAAHFGGISGGAITATMTAVGYSGLETLGLVQQMNAAYAACRASGCALLDVAKPIFVDAIVAKDPNAAKNLSGRMNVWACQVDVTSPSNKHSVAQGTDTWTSIDDLVQAVMASSTIPCFDTNARYTLFRGSAYIDGGYCADFAQACPKTGGDKCVKTSASFVGENLGGTPYPTVDNCPAVVPASFLPYPGKPYAVPKDNSTWAVRPAGGGSGNCTAEDVPFVRQGVSAKPDMFPFFYQKLPPVFADACEWLTLSGGVPSQLQALAMFETGVAEAFGWADAHGYCATPPPP